jgi:hypothetical protein
MESLSKEIKCPLCNRPVTLKVDSEIINCSNCKGRYIYKYCLECSSIIYFTKIDYDGYNIQCPYVSCGAIGCTVKCEKCNKKIFYKNKYSQGDKIKCSNCQNVFKKVRCPSLECQKSIILGENFLEGQPLKCEHKDGTFCFQKVGCWYCGRHCVWNNSKGKYYIDGQTIICPYKECERMTNKVICPKCLNSSVITRGNLDMGKKINCLIKGCENVYNIYFCPFCKKTNYGNGSPIAGENLTCQFCKESFTFVNCFFCKQINFWKKPNNYLPCQTVVCSNESCRKKSALIPCPFCKRVNHFSRGVFILGQKYACSYRECKNEFVILYCGKCNMTHIKKASLDPNILYVCDHCKNLMPTIQCPKCFKFCCLPNNTTIETHTTLKCPYEKCGQVFYYYRCPFCKHDFNSDKYITSNIKCPFQNCNKEYTYFKCKKCLKDNYDVSSMDCEEINCTNCNEQNNIINQPDANKFSNLKKAYITQGEKYVFDNPEEDPYDRAIINSLIQTKIYEIPFSEKGTSIISGDNDNYVKTCVICLANPIEWILAPCGHKCVCQTCGKIIKEKFKKCPICKEIIIGVLEKVIDD